MGHYADTSKKSLHGSVDDLEYRGATSAWEDIIVDPDFVCAHAALPAVHERGGELTRHESTNYLLERVSIPVHKPLGQMENHDSACIFASNAQTSPSILFLDTADSITNVGTDSHLEHAVNDAHHRRDLQVLGIEHVEDGNDTGVVRSRSYITTPKDDAVSPGPPCSAHMEPSPYILAADLDHAFEVQLLRGSPDAKRETMGSPMFVSIEQSDYSVRLYPPIFSFALEDAILGTAKLPEAVLRFAFPSGDNDFMDNYTGVMKFERERRKYCPLGSRPSHNPRHDADSAFWVFFWAAARAVPRDASLKPPSRREIDAFNTFCNTMLAHVIDENKSDQRDWILQAASFARLFSPALKPFVELFETMARYLNVPWHIYEATGQVKPDHAHVAFRRLLLRFILDLEEDNPAMLRLWLDTKHPRVSALPACCQSPVRASDLETKLPGCPESGGSRSSKKRKANEPPDADVRFPKKACHKETTASEIAQFSTPISAAQGERSL